MPRFPIHVEKYLSDAGWYEGRWHPIDGYVQLLEHNGYKLFESAAKILSEFGGLVIKYKNEGTNVLLNGGADEVRIGPEFAADIHAAIHQTPIGRPAIPIGDCFRHHANLIVSDDGRIFSEFETDIVQIADNFDNAFEAFILFGGIKSF